MIPSHVGLLYPVAGFFGGNLSFHSPLLEGHGAWLANGRVTARWAGEPLDVIEHIGARLFSGPAGFRLTRSVFGEENRLSDADLSQTFPDRLKEQVTP